MKQGLQLKFSQQLTMTPQLQQAIRLLQLSTLELQQEIQQALDENPLLELEDASVEGETQIDKDEWDESYSADCGSHSSSAPGQPFDGEDSVFEGNTEDSLHEHLLWQMRLSHFTPTDELIALAIIDSIDEQGYLNSSLDDIFESLDPRIQELVDGDDIAVVLKRIQHFDPIGVAARDIQECLLLQLCALPEKTPARSSAMQAVQHHLDLLGSRDYRTLARKLKLNETALCEVIQLIQTLQPRPGDGFGGGDSDYVIPDVLVRKKNGRWIVELNANSVPKLKVNDLYASLCQANDDMQYIRQQTQEAKWFIRSLESRHETLLKVASSIVQRQQAFFEFGEEAMKPMVLADIAQAVDMHESTISRVTTQKFMHTPRGLFELKYFFSSQLSTDSGEDASSTAIRALLKKLVAAENPKKPLSDSKLTELMAQQGIQVARRTIAKYREALHIPPSSQRKRLI